MNCLARCAGIALALFTLSAGAVEIQRWDRLPLAIPLIVGQERIVFVDQNVRVGVPRNLEGKLRVQSTGGALYLLASAPIEPTRLQLQNLTSGEIMLVDIAATPGQDNLPALEPVKIVAGDNPSARYGQVTSTTTQNAKPSTQQESDTAEQPVVRRETPIPVVLTRYAAQMLYAPLRTVEPVEGIAQVNTNRRLDVSTLLPSLPIEASILGAWRLDGFSVTAVKLRNTSTQQLVLDPRDLMGSFVAATFQHPYLGAKGDASDTTTVYLVTQGRSIADALLPSGVGQIDPKGGNRAQR
ncbi:Conjugal transfer protein [Pseudomonas sp. 8Z]|uniref:TIGR03749 family integrating conjugative element protein n=1 Tax=Pseudomonas sp. 8Z TaxID=2653166 RepID=UPI0012F12E33|nr:TIGR03749 family integrating conjugative element protein [Pseudomonas sp. 8Z]VXC23203.1 Conjugal transfer protein [Pseudomonas sp. 8Z]